MTREELKEHCEKQIRVCEMWAHSRGERSSGKVYEEHKLILELLEQEPKVGHWIYQEDTLEYACSECNRRIDTKRFENPYIRYPYCHCGCRMIEPQESEGEE